MYLGLPCPGSFSGFEDGITNGADWYAVNGGMQDYNYVNSNCFEVTIEQACYKYPYASALPGIWEDNRDALVAYIWEVQKGVSGFVRDANGLPVANAKVEIIGRNKTIYTTENGEYWRLLSPGLYTVAVYTDDFSTCHGYSGCASLRESNAGFHASASNRGNTNTHQVSSNSKSTKFLCLTPLYFELS